MPSSDPANKPWTAIEMSKINPKTILDVGSGKGLYLDLIRETLGNSVIVDAIEIWEPYVSKFNLNERYDNLYIEDIRKHNFNKEYDLVILGDVLEHMSEKDAIDVWEKVSKNSKYAIISIPIIHYHQGEYEGNPYEVHVEEDWNTERVLRCFKGIIKHQEFPITGVFLAKFKD
jgi:hypothetical protein